MEELKLEEKVVGEILDAITDLPDDSRVGEIQPPFSVRMAMAKAAAQVLMAFERGYQMNESE